ncbi:ornithine carbamoyltransferase [Acrocarpospora corrugata]|uniref:Ornithine carbamoyltransferase n=1 Tax=Acrocarpospora corrugata TaxID=35763 RepID=A0A5M3W7N5_9ACTN|nr:ornithine carbamoyltransferase [Acrocarpospora corrugata]GES03171.1 ornithine carbamoyltransferase [Acrocarpospora corrugata]
MHRHLISIRDLDDGDLDYLVRRGAWFAEERDPAYRPLTGRVVGGYFRRTSTRTRTAFASAALRLGAGYLPYGPADLQLSTGESIEDTAQVFARMLDALVVRTADAPDEVRALAAQPSMPVINAMTADEHPTQAIADLTTLLRRFGRIDGLRILYVGEGNNTAAALALGLARFHDVQLCLATPAGYGVAESVLDLARDQATPRGTRITQCHDLGQTTAGADVVYTTRWQTTGTSKPDPDWRRLFEPFQVNGRLMERHPDALFMHDLPAHRGEDVTAAVLDGPSSIAFEQAENKLHSAKALLEWCLLGRRH